MKMCFLISAISFVVTAHAQQNFLEKVFGVDYSRYVWDGFKNKPSDTIPGKSRYGVRINGGPSLLISRSGALSYSHNQTDGDVRVYFRPFSGLTFTTKGYTTKHELKIANPDFSFKRSATDFDIEQTISSNHDGHLNGEIKLGLNSNNFAVVSHRQFILKPTFTKRLYFWGTFGTRDYTIPTNICLIEGIDLAPPIQLNQVFYGAGATFPIYSLLVKYQVDWLQNRHPLNLTSEYTISDSGYTYEHSLNVLWNNKRVFASLAAAGLYGEHSLKAFSLDKGINRHFSYQDVNLASLLGSGNVSFQVGGQNIFLRSNISLLELRAGHPSQLSGHYTLVSNNFLDSYKGLVRSVFSAEKYLFKGQFSLLQISAAGGFEKNIKHWRVKCDLMYTQLRLIADYALTEKKTSLIIFTTSKIYSGTMPDIHIHLLTPSIELEKSYRYVSLHLYGRQAVPVYVKTYSSSDTEGASSASGDDAFNGTDWGGLDARAWVSVNW